MDKLVQEYLESGKALKERYDELKYGKIIKREAMAERYQSITQPLQNLNNKLSFSSANSATSSKFLTLLGSKGVKLDTVFGIREEPGKGMFIGNQPIEVKNDNIIFTNTNTTYVGTPGLWELLTLATPKNYTQDDLDTYAKIIVQSNVYRQGNDPTSHRFKGSRSNKYRQIVKPIVDKYVRSATVSDEGDDDEEEEEDDDEFVDAKEHGDVVEGRGFRKISIHEPVEYVYWDTVEELLERLCILYGEYKSGNTNPLLLNEIVNIIQEFKEI